MTKALKILAAIDFSEASLEALRWGAALARRFGGEVALLSVVNWPGRPAGAAKADFTAFYDADDGLRILTERRLAAAVAEVPDLAERGPACLVRFGSPELEIVKEALEMEADLIVMGTHGRQGMGRALSGSVAEGVLRHAPCPVTVVRQGVHPASEKLAGSAA